jgi:carboxypeptidase T
VTVNDPATGEQRTTTSDGATGHYQRTMLAGTVNVHVSAASYLAEDLSSLILNGGQTTTRDFRLLPTCTIFSDDVESGNSLWTAEPPWVITNNVPGNATRVWDTPNYADNLDSSLVLTNPYDLTGYSDIALSFDDRCDTEPGYDYGYVEFSANGGTSWSAPIYTCTGRPNWQSQHINLSAAANGSPALKVRFRLSSDPSVNEPLGWAIDNIKLEAGGDACRAQQPPNDVIFANGFE